MYIVVEQTPAIEMTKVGNTYMYMPQQSLVMKLLQVIVSHFRKEK